MMLLLLLVFVVKAEYTYWKYGDNSRVLPETQRYLKYISEDIEIQSEVMDVEWLKDPVITSNNDILIHGHSEIYDEITLYQFDQFLNLKSELVLQSNLSYYDPIYPKYGYIYERYPIYHEYDNNKYYIHYLTLNDSKDIYGKLLVVKIENHEMNILWQFDHYVYKTKNNDTVYNTIYWDHQVYQPLVYDNYIWFQHQNKQTKRWFDCTPSLIKRYLFRLNDGAIIWNKTNNNKKYETYSIPIIFDKYNQISVIYGNQYYYIDEPNCTSALYSFNFMTGDLNWERNYSDYLNQYIGKYPTQAPFGECDYPSFILIYFDKSASLSIYHEYDLLIQTGGLEVSNYGFSHISAFNLSHNGKMVSEPTILEDSYYPFVFNSRNGMNDLMVQFPGAEGWSWFRDKCCPGSVINCTNSNNWYPPEWIAQIHIHINDIVHFNITGAFPYHSCEQSFYISSPIDSYSSLIVSTRDGKIVVVTRDGSGNMIVSPGDYAMIPNQINHDNISEQLMYFVNNEKNRIVAHRNKMKNVTTDTPVTSLADDIVLLQFNLISFVSFILLVVINL